MPFTPHERVKWLPVEWIYMSRHTKRGEGGQFEGDVSEQEILEAFDRADAPVMTAKEVADELPIKKDAVVYRLNKMHENGLVGRKDAGASAVVWWAKVEPKPDVEGVEHLEASDFRGMIETDKTAAELVEEAREKDREREERLMDVATDE